MDTIKKNILGRTGFSVSEMGLGAWAVGSKGYGPVEKKQGVETIEMYMEAGGNHIDTAPVYGGSEALIGDVIGNGALREKVFIGTKTKMGDCAETVSKIRGACEESLSLLKTDYIDIYYLHTPPEDIDTISRALDEFEKLKEEGKIRAIGASIKAAAVTANTVGLCHTYIDTGRLDVLQVAYSILRQANAEIFEKAKENSVGVVTRTSIESGFLSGKYRPGHVFPSDHRMRWSKETLAKIFSLADELSKWVIRPPYQSLAEVAIRFSLAPEEVSSLLVGARTTEQLQRNLKTLLLPPLDPDIIERLQQEFSGRTEEFNPDSQGWTH
ncbi:MAG: aldo/keto reductase [Desulfopila sp.]|nr:aldo/keto reductase [Desulfopila sp.]